MARHKTAQTTLTGFVKKEKQGEHWQITGKEPHNFQVPVRTKGLKYRPIFKRNVRR